MTEKQKEINFDFNGQKSDEIRQKKNAEQKAKTESFLKLGRNTIVALTATVAIIGGGVWGVNAYQKHIDNEIQNIENVLKTSDKGAILGLIKNEQTSVQQTFAKNQILINDFGRYKDLIEVINFGNQVAVFNTNNAKIYKDVSTSLNSDYEAVSKVFNAVNGTRDEKIKELLDSSDFSKFNQWKSNLSNKQLMYSTALIDLNKELIKQHVFLNNTQNEIVENVQQRLKNKDYNIDAAQANFSSQIKKETTEDIDNLKQARAELKDTEDALREDAKEEASVDGNGDDTSAKQLSKVSQILTDDDVAQAETAMTVVQQEAMNQLTQDKAKVDALIAQANLANGTLPTPPGANSTLTNNVANNGIAPQANPQVVHVHTGPSFMDYYLMYSFMNSGSSGTTVNNNYYNGSSSGAAMATRSYQPVKALANSTNPYSLKNDGSYLNKTLTQKADLSGNSALKGSLAKTNSSISKPNINTLRSQINTARSRASQVRTTRAAELSRMGYANSYEAGKSGSSSRGSKSSISSSRGVKSSSVSRGSFGGKAGGFGG